MEDHRSSDLFVIAENVGIPLRPGAEEPFEDSQYEAFVQGYWDWAKKRDASLRTHLRSSVQLFRTLIRGTERAYGSAYQVQWYFDEILIRDPVGALLDRELAEDQLEERKIQLRRMLQELSRFRLALDAGYVLLYGQDARAEPPEADQASVERLAGQTEIAEALRLEIRWGLEPRTADDGREWQVYEARLDTAGSFGWHTRGLEGQAISPAIRVGERLKAASPDEVERALGSDIVEEADRLFPTEIRGTLRHLAVATSMSAVPLFDRQVDGLIIQAAGEAEGGGFTQIGALNVALPYLEGAEPGALVELRQSDPEAFAEFRVLMNSLVRRAQAGELGEPLDQAAAREIVPHLRTLEDGFKALKRTRQFATMLGGAAVVGGGLAGFLLGPAASSLAAVAAPAAASLLATFDKEGKLTSNPFYWLWRARR